MNSSTPASDRKARGRYVRVQAHRGFREDYPENTLIAFEKALNAGADLIEMDLAISADGHVIIHHAVLLAEEVVTAGAAIQAIVALRYP